MSQSLNYPVVPPMLVIRTCIKRTKIFFVVTESFLKMRDFVYSLQASSLVQLGLFSLINEVMC